MSLDAVRLGRSFRMNVAARFCLAALLALAPLACVLFCAIVSEAHAHDAPLSHKAIAHHAPDEGSGRAPLTDIQRLVHAVTDCLPPAGAWRGAWQVVAVPIIFRPAARRINLPPPTPPPRPSRSA